MRLTSLFVVELQEFPFASAVKMSEVFENLIVTATRFRVTGQSTGRLVTFPLL